MKMNIKGLVFVGFAAAVFAGAANAVETGAGDKIVTSKRYVDAKVVDSLAGDQTDKAPSVRAVKTAVDTATGLIGNGTLSIQVGSDHAQKFTANQATNQTTTVTLGSAAKLGTAEAISSTSSNDDAATAKAVYDYVVALPGSEAYTAGTHVADITNHKINVEGDGTIASGNDHLVTGGTVYTAVEARVPKQIGTASDNGKVLTVDAQGQVALSAADTYQKKLTPGNFVSIDNDGNIKTTYSAGTNVSISGTGQISATDTTYSADDTTVKLNGTTFSANTTGGVANGGTNLTTGGQVYDFVTGLVPATLPTTCTVDAPCAMVLANGLVSWEPIAQQ